MVLALLGSVPDLAESLLHAFEAAADDLAAADYADGCPIGPVALEVASSNDVWRIATEVFRGVGQRGDTVVRPLGGRTELGCGDCSGVVPEAGRVREARPANECPRRV